MHFFHNNLFSAHLFCSSIKINKIEKNNSKLLLNLAKSRFKNNEILENNNLMCLQTNFNFHRVFFYLIFL